MKKEQIATEQTMQEVLEALGGGSQSITGKNMMIATEATLIKVRDAILAGGGGGGGDSKTKEMIAPLFSSQVNYSAGEYVIYSNKLYKFIVDHDAGDWDADDVTEASGGISGDVASLQQEVDRFAEVIENTLVLNGGGA